MKKLLFAGLFIFSINISHSETVRRVSCPIRNNSIYCHQNTDQSLIDIHNAIANVQNAISNFNVQPPDCIETTGLGLENMQEWLNNWANESNTTQENTLSSPKGKISFDPNEHPKMIDLFQKLTKNFNPISTDISKNVQAIQPPQTPVQPAEPVQSKCSTVICASQEIFGEKQGVQLLYMLARYGFNGSPYPFSQRTHSEMWDSKGLDKVLAGLASFPEWLLPFINNKPLVRFSRGYTRNEYNNMGSNKCVSANSFIEVFDCIEQFSDEQFISTIVHEVAHVIADEADLDQTPTWFKFSGWEETKAKKGNTIHVSYTSTKPECLVSKYAATNPNEDFAESVVAYRYNPQLLKENCLNKYLYIKDLVFNGEEYINNICKK